VQIKEFPFTQDYSTHQPIPSGVAAVHKASSDPLKATYLRAPSEACDTLLMLNCGLPDHLVLALPRVLNLAGHAVPQSCRRHSQVLSCHVARLRSSVLNNMRNTEVQKGQNSSLCGVSRGSVWCAFVSCLPIRSMKLGLSVPTMAVSSPNMLSYPAEIFCIRASYEHQNQCLPNYSRFNRFLFISHQAI
jgi:hypothetical protein